MPRGETPTEWGARNAEEFVKSTKESLGKEMYFAIRLNLGCTLLFAIGTGLAIGYWQQWAFGLMGATFVLFGVSLYWAWYIRRGLNRRWEKEMAAEKFATQKARTEIAKPPDNLLVKNRTPDVNAVEQRPDGPQRRFGG